MSSDPFSHTVKLKRGNGKDVQKTKVTAETIEELDERVQEVQDRMENWADGYRAIQPRERPLADDQDTLTETTA